MADFSVRTGAQSAQGLRANNEDRFVVDDKHHLYLVADGMGGQEAGEKASGLAAEIIPRVVGERLAAHEDAGRAVGAPCTKPIRPSSTPARSQGRRTSHGHHRRPRPAGQRDQVFVANLGDSRAYLVRGDRVEQLTVDHNRRRRPGSRNGHR